MKEKLAIKLNLTYFILYGAIACFYPFLTFYFRERGLSYTEIGIAYAVSSIMSVVAQPIWGFITDKHLNKKKTLIIITISSALVIYNFIFAQSFYYIILSIAMIISFQSSIFPVVDAYSYEIIDHYKEIQYGRVRLMGSIGYAIVALVLGQVVKAFGINSSYFIYSIIMLLGTFIIFSIDFKGRSNKKRSIDIKDVLKLVKDKRFSLFMVSVIFVNISMGSNGSYVAVLIEKTGGDVSKLGMLSFIMAISELPVLFYGKRLIKKYGELNLYLLGVTLFSVRFFLNAISTEYTLVLATQIMQSVTYTFYLIAALQYIDSIAPNKMRTSAMTFLAAVSALGALIGNMGGGILLEHISIFSLYKVISLIALVSVAFGFVLKSMKVSEE